MGLGARKGSIGTYLSIAGGFIWDRKKDDTDPNYDTQKFTRADGTKGERAGACYAELTGMITKVEFRTHQEYGESVNVTFESKGEIYIVSVSTNNRFSQDIMKYLLKADLTKPTYMRPYDFIGREKKRVQGVEFRQDGEKVNLRNDDSPQESKEFFKEATKKKIKRFFEDLSDWFVAECEEKVIPQLNAIEKQGLGSKKEISADDKEVIEKTVEESKATSIVEKKVETPKVTPLKMKLALKVYIKENYPDKELPTLSREDLLKWYMLSTQTEELPFADPVNAEVASDNLKSELEELIQD